MQWLDEVRLRNERGNQILFTQDGEFLRELAKLAKLQPHRVMVLWALEFADEIAAGLSARYPHEKRPEIALQKAWAWAAGDVKMREAQRAILDAHAFAKEIDSAPDIALCHALGQACGVVHAPGHAMGLPMYELTAIVRREGLEACEEAVEARMGEYIERLKFWSENFERGPRRWAEFMLK